MIKSFFKTFSIGLIWTVVVGLSCSLAPYLLGVLIVYLTGFHGGSFSSPFLDRWVAGIALLLGMGFIWVVGKCAQEDW